MNPNGWVLGIFKYGLVLVGVYLIVASVRAAVRNWKARRVWTDAKVSRDVVEVKPKRGRPKKVLS